MLDEPVLPADWVERMTGEWHRAERVWHGPVQRTTWEAGPFEYPVPPPDVVEERWEGDVETWRENGRVHVVYGPWEVVIRGLAGWAERRVLAVWQVERAWTVDGGEEPSSAAAPERPGPAGASERLPGASEARLGASEVRLRGASERWRLGASEVRLGGASERVRQGASEVRWGGASERRLGGASEMPTSNRRAAGR
jgi:hypothetical protein